MMKEQNKPILSRRQMLKMMAMGSAGALLAACAPKTTPTTEPTMAQEQAPQTGGLQIETGHLTCLLCCGTDDTHELQARFNTYFEETYPTITTSLELTPGGTNYFEKLQTLVAAGTPPDVFDMWEGYVQPYAANGVLMDLTPYVEADSEWTMDSFQPAAVAAASYQDRLYCIIRDFYPGPAMFFYNIDLFDKAGVEYPTFDWDWNKMREAAMKLTMDTSGDGKVDQWGLAFEPWFVPWLFWIWSNGGDLFNADETQCALTDPKAYQPLQFWADLVNVDQCALPSSEASAMQGASNAFRTGVLGMYEGYAWDIADMKAAKDQGLNWGCVLPPGAPPDNKRSFYMHLECWAASKDTKVPNACWQYIKDFTEKFNAEFITYFPGIPMLKSQIDLFLTEENKSYGWDKLPDIIADPKNIRIPGAGAKFDKISQLVQAELDLVFTGEKSAKDAVETACPQVNDELARQTSFTVPENCNCNSY
jgi:multiple sugar transport system substrate-binding protein